MTRCELDGLMALYDGQDSDHEMCDAYDEYVTSRAYLVANDDLDEQEREYPGSTVGWSVCWDMCQVYTQGWPPSHHRRALDDLDMYGLSDWYSAIRMNHETASDAFQEARRRHLYCMA